MQRAYLEISSYVAEIGELFQTLYKPSCPSFQLTYIWSRDGVLILRLRDPAADAHFLDGHHIERNSLHLTRRSAQPSDNPVGVEAALGKRL